MQLNYNNLYEIISINAEKTPDKEIIHYYEDDYSFKAAKEKIDTIARVLVDNGVRQGNKIGVLLGNSPEFVFTFFAVQKIGAVSVPQNIFLKTPEIAANFKDCAVDYLVTSEAFAPVVEPLRGLVPSIKKYFSYEKTSFESINIYEQTPKSADFKCPAKLDDLAMLIYTSGTTGTPKGVMLSNRNLLANALQYTELLDSYDGTHKMTTFLPLFHAYAFLTCIVGPFYCANSTIIFNSINDVPKAEFAKYIMKHKPTVFMGIPQVYSALSRRKLTPEEQAALPYQLYVSGGAPLPMKTIELFKDSYGKNIIEGYGLSEASPLAAFNPRDRQKAGSIGKIAPFMEYKVVGEDGKEVKRGEPGELVIRGANVMMGYWNQPKATAEVLSPDGWLRTGDVVTEDEDHYLFIVDRLKDLIISKGINIYPRELEEYLYKHPAIEHAAVIGVPEKDGNETVVAYVQLREGQHLTEQEVKDYMKENFANYKVPKSVIFTDSIPVNASGKVMKLELKKQVNKNTEK